MKWSRLNEDHSFEYARLFVKVNDEEERVYRTYMRFLGTDEWKDPIYFLTIREQKEGPLAQEKN